MDYDRLKPLDRLDIAAGGLGDAPFIGDTKIRDLGRLFVDPLLPFAGFRQFAVRLSRVKAGVAV